MADGPIKGVRGTDHIGITVPDLDEAIAFFTDVFGCEELFRMGPFSDGEGTWMKDNLNVHPRAVLERFAMVRCHTGANLEIFQYASPDQGDAIPKNSDVGGHHIAFYVDDLEGAIADLRERGITVLGEPKDVPDTPLEGIRWCYFLAPWGLQLELVSYPDGLAYEKQTDRRLWNVTRPAD